MYKFFSGVASKTAVWMGQPGAFIGATLACIIWAVSGPIFHYSDTWQLVINTATTVLTFLAVFLIQNSQNRDARAMHLKLDELIRANKNARNRLLALEDMSDEELVKLQREFEDMRDRVLEARKSLAPKRTTGVPKEKIN